MAQAFKFEFLFDESKAEKSIENVAKSFVDAFNKGKPFDGTKAELEQFVGLASRRLIELSAKYKETQDALRKDGGRASDNPQLKQIQEQINSLRQLRDEAKRAYDSMSQSAKKVDLVSIFTGARHAQGSSNEITNKIRGLENDLKVLKATLKETEEEFAAKGISTKGNAFFERIKSDIAASEAELDGYKARLKEVKEEEKKLSDEQKKARRQMAASNADLQKSFETGRGFSGTNLQLKQEISDTSTELRRLKAQYQETIAAIQKSGGEVKDNPELAKIKDSIDETNAKLHGLRENLKERRMGSENMFQGIAQGAQGLMGAFTAAQGAAAMFGAEEEKLQKIQTKLQASMSILMGLQRAGNALQSTSQFRVQVINKLMEKYHQMNLKVAASEGIKKAAMAGVVGIIAAMIAGLTALIIRYSKYADEVERAKELQKAFKSEFANSAATEMTTLTQLRAKWKAANGNVAEQKKLVMQNKSALESLGITETNLKKVEEKLFSAEVRDNIIKKARAAAYLAQVNALITKEMELQAKIENERNRPKSWWERNALTDYAVQQKRDKNIAEFEKEAEKIAEEREKILANYEAEIAGIEDTAGDKALNNTISSRLEAAKRGYESILRLNEDRENKLAEARNALIQSNTQREIEQLRQSHEKRLQEIEREKKDYIEKLKEQAKLDFLARNPNANAEDFGSNWKPSPNEQKRIDEYYAEMARIENTAFSRSYSQLIQQQQKTRLDYMKKYGSSELVKSAIEQEYEALMKEAAKSGDTWRWLELDKERKEKIWQAENASRLEYLEQYGSIREKEQAIDEKYNHLIEQTNDKYQKKLLEQQRATEKFRLQQQKGGRLYNIFRDADRMNIVQIQQAIEDAKAEIERLSQDAPANADKIDALKNALENLKQAANDFSLVGFFRSLTSSDKDDPTKKASLIERLEAMRKAWTEMSDDAKAKAVGGWASGIADSLGKAAGYMRQVAEASGDPRLSGAAEKLESVAQNFSAAGQGAASGGWVGAIVAGVLDIFGQIGEGIVSASTQEIAAAKYADQWREALKDVTLQMREAEYYSPFGERGIAKAREGARVLVDAAEQYRKKLAELNAIYGTGGYRESMLRGVGYNRQLTRALMKGGFDEFGGSLAQAAVITKHRKWGIDEFSTLEKLYPELFKDGELMIENLKRLLESESFLNDSANAKLREQLENLVKLRDAYDDALSTIDDAVNSTFGDLASDLTDIIWDSVMNGTDAWAEFKKTGAAAISALGKQMIQEMLISTYLDQFKERARNAYMLGSSGEMNTELRNIMGDIFGGLESVFDATTAVAQEYKDWAAERGFDLTESASRTAASKAISGVTQESFDDALGRFTAIQSHTYELNETTKTLREQQGNLLAVTSQILFEVQGIHRDTERMQESLDTIQGDMTLVRSGVATMTDRGVRMLN